MTTPRGLKNFKAIPPLKYDPDLSEVANEISWNITAIKNFAALEDRYQINSTDPNRWFLLCLKMAVEFVPGFAPIPRKSPQGRKPTGRSGADDVILLFELGKAQSENKSVLNAARHLAKKYPRFKGKNPGTLRQRYYALNNAATPEGQRVRDLIRHLLLSGKA